VAVRPDGHGLLTRFWFGDSIFRRSDQVLRSECGDLPAAARQPQRCRGGSQPNRCPAVVAAPGR
jgi:hypothetical protein